MRTQTTATPSRRFGFTIVEMLVVVSIIAVLAGILLPALGGARRRAKKLEETNRIRQVGVAWNLYAQSNRDAALPGFLDSGMGDDTDVQGPMGWNVRYKLPAAIDTASTPGLVEHEDAEEWPWRLMAYLDYNQDIMLGHLGLEQQSELVKWEMSNYEITDPTYAYPTSWGYQPFPLETPRPRHIATQPAFGYNALYVGGWWEMDISNPAEPRAVSRFSNAMTIPTDGSAPARTSVVARSPSAIRKSSDLVTFCSAAKVIPGEYEGFTDLWPGSHFVVPPIVAQTEMWRPGVTSELTIVNEGFDTIEETVTQPLATPIPIARYTGQVTVLYADGHTAPVNVGALADQRSWVNTADKVRFQHTP